MYKSKSEIENCLKDKPFFDKFNEAWQKIKNEKYFWHKYNYEIPKQIIGYEFSYTFNCFGALVIFNDDTQMFTYPKR